MEVIGDEGKDGWLWYALELFIFFVFQVLA